MLSTKFFIRLFLISIFIIVVFKTFSIVHLSDEFVIGCMGYVTALIGLHQYSKKGSNNVDKNI